MEVIVAHLTHQTNAEYLPLVVARSLCRRRPNGVLRYTSSTIQFTIVELKDSVDIPPQLPSPPIQLNRLSLKSEFGVNVLTPGDNPVIECVFSHLITVNYAIDHCQFSIVAVHGLDGHLEKSWTADNGVLWLRDLLPERIPHARILTYGYDAYTRGRDRLAKESLHDLANDLVSSLATERRISKVSRGPSYPKQQYSYFHRLDDGL